MCGTVIAGRLRQIATLRLLGADSRTLRRDVCRSCGIAGLVGGAIGIVVGTLTAGIARIWLVHRGTLPARAYASADVRSMLRWSPWWDARRWPAMSVREKCWRSTLPRP